jgi:hypothetical protein
MLYKGTLHESDLLLYLASYGSLRCFAPYVSCTVYRIATTCSYGEACARRIAAAQPPLRCASAARSHSLPCCVGWLQRVGRSRPRSPSSFAMVGGRGGRRRERLACAVLAAAAWSPLRCSAWDHCVVPSSPAPAGYSVSSATSASCASGYTGSTVTINCAPKWKSGDWASVGVSGAYDQPGIGANDQKAQSANIGTYNGQPVTQATCHLAAAANGANSDGVQPNGATWFINSCFANYRLTYPFTDSGSTSAVTTLFSSTDNGGAGSPTCSSNTCSGGCWASCVNSFTYTGCTYSGCDASAAPTNGGVGTCTSTLAAGQTCTPTCNNGFTLTPSTGSSCSSSGVFAAATCVASVCTVSAPNNGALGSCGASLTSGSSCIPTCNSGYQVVGSMSCTNGALTSTATCVQIVCDASAAPTNGGVGTCTSTLAAGQTCTPTCNNGFTLTPSSGSSCSSSGVFAAATCVANACTVSAPNNGALGSCGASLTSGSSCIPTCNSGYQVVGSMSCTNGALTSTATCVQIVCDASATPTNGGVGTCTNSLPAGSTCTPTCNPSFHLVGTTSCTLNAGTNSATLSGATCVANSCTAGSGIRTGFALSAAAATSTSIAGLGVIACYSGLPISYSGVPTATCLTDGGSFAFGGCNENTCTAGSGDRTGYSFSGAAATATKPSALGAIACAPGYSVAPGLKLSFLCFCFR